MRISRAAEALFNFPRLYRAKFAVTSIVLAVVRPLLFRTLVSPGDVVTAAAMTPGCAVCEIGCGDGENFRTVIAHVGEVAYTGIDINPNMVDFCREKYPGQRWLCANAPYEFERAEFDCCLIVNVLHHLNSRDDTVALLREAGRIARRIALFEPLQSENALLRALKKLYWSLTDGGLYYPRLADYAALYAAAGLEVEWERYSSPLRQFYGAILRAQA